jgi:hypothetical protein
MSEKSNLDFRVYANNAEGTVFNINDLILFVLGDIRRELQTLNRLLGCTNFTTLPQTLREIRDNTKKRKYVRKER